MKTKRALILLSVLIFVFGLILIYHYPLIKRIISHYYMEYTDARHENYGVIDINNKDKTLLGAESELRQLPYLGYIPGTYPQLDKLSEKIDLQVVEVPKTVASFLYLAAYKAEKQADTGNLQGILPLAGITAKALNEISQKGFPEIAVTYILCTLETIERILTNKDLAISADYYSKLSGSLQEMDAIITRNPSSQTNRFKEDGLLEIRACLILLNMKKYYQENKKWPTSDELVKLMGKIPADPYEPTIPLKYGLQGADWHIKSVGQNGKDDGYDAINYCPLPLKNKSAVALDIVISSKTRQDLRSLWRNREFNNSAVSIKMIKGDNVQVMHNKL